VSPNISLGHPIFKNFSVQTTEKDPRKKESICPIFSVPPPTEKDALKRSLKKIITILDHKNKAYNPPENYIQNLGTEETSHHKAEEIELAASIL